MNYGEEILTIDTSKGLWLADDYDAVPDGYMLSCVNFVRNDSATWEIRPNFMAAYGFPTLNISNTDITTAVEYEYKNYTSYLSATVQSFDLESTNDNHPVALFVAFEKGTSTQRHYFFRRNGTHVSTGVTATGGGVVTSIAQYRDRHYGTEYGTASIYRYNYDTTVARSLIISLPVTPSVSGYCTSIVAFRDRIFAFLSKSSRVYYSDQAASGGYPESWNGGNNFFDLPDSGAVVTEGIVLNDRLYLFTTKGVYQLYANGSPSSWQITPVDPTLRLQSRNHIAVINGNFVYTDLKSVYIYNGASTSLEIGRPIKHAFKPYVAEYFVPFLTNRYTFTGPNTATLHPFLNGFLIAFHYLSAATPFTRTRVPKYYYFDGEVWSEIQFDDYINSGEDHYQLIGTMKNKFAKAFVGESQRSNDMFIEARTSGGSGLAIQARTVRYDNTGIESDPGFNYRFVTKEIEPFTLRNSRLKWAYVKLKSHINPLSIYTYVNRDESLTEPSSLGAGYDIGTNSSNILKLYINDRGKSFFINITGILRKASPGPANGNDLSLFLYPALRINELGIALNTDTRNTTQRIDPN